jgi:hypothetical protein
MKKLLFCGLSLALMASAGIAAEGRASRSALSTSATPTLLAQTNDIVLPAPLSPVPDSQYAPSGEQPLTRYPVESYTVQSPVLTDFGNQTSPPAYGVSGQPLELYSNVKYRGERNIAPCAVPTIVQVADPCNRDRCCKTCVNVQICVPPCDPACVKVTRNGNKVRYDYGKYAVAVTSIGSRVVVHYED